MYIGVLASPSSLSPSSTSQGALFSSTRPTERDMETINRARRIDFMDFIPKIRLVPILSVSYMLAPRRRHTLYLTL